MEKRGSQIHGLVVQAFGAVLLRSDCPNLALRWRLLLAFIKLAASLALPCRLVKVLPIGQLPVRQLAGPVGSDHYRRHAQPVDAGSPTPGQERQPALRSGGTFQAYYGEAFSFHSCGLQLAAAVGVCLFAD